MRLLVLSVDRDNDLGRKTGIQGPTIGREATLQAAVALALADPEEADANGMFAAVKEYDEISVNKEAFGADQVFVAAAVGHIREGSQADAAMAHQIDQILAATGADHVILVSDGGEDEHVMPIIQTRLKVDGVKRVIIKQAKNLEGALALFQRLMSDEKLQRRFFLPLALLLLAAAVSFLYERPQIFIAACLFLGSFYIFVQVFQWQEPIGNVFTRIGAELQAGKLSFLTSLAALVVVVWGGYKTLDEIKEFGEVDAYVYTTLFFHLIFWWVVGAVLIVITGRALDQLVRERRIRPRYWKAGLFALSAGILIHPCLTILRKYVLDGTLVSDQLTLDFYTQMFFGGFVFVVGLISHRYFRQMAGRSGASPLGPAK